MSEIKVKEGEPAEPSGGGEPVEPAAPHITPPHDSRKRSREAGEPEAEAVPEQHSDSPAAKRVDAKDQVGEVTARVV